MSFGIKYAPSINEQSYTYNLITSLSGSGSNISPTGSTSGYNYQINFNTQNTQTLKSVIINKKSTINTDNIICTLDNPVNKQQIYTIGKSVQSIWVGVGSSTNTIAYSTDNGQTWTGIGITIFNTSGFGICWNGNIFVAVGTAPSSIAYSNNGINWTSVISSPLIYGRGISWNGNKFVAVGNGSINTIAWSDDGTSWTGVTGKTIFSNIGNGVAWNGQMWIAVGFGSDHSIAYSNDGVIWTGIGTSIFSIGNGVVWNGQMWVAVGIASTSNNTTIAWSDDGISWNGVSDYLFAGGSGYGVAWNGQIWVVVGREGDNYIGYSYDGKIWIAAVNNANIIIGGCYGVYWNGNIFIAVGGDTNKSIATSSDGIYWTSVVDSINIFSVSALGIVCNSSRDINIIIEAGSTTSSKITPTTVIALNNGDKLDIFSPSYYNNSVPTLATITIASEFIV
jgi:hypothetical protein